MKNISLKLMVVNALFLALGLLLPLLTAQIPQFGNMLLPMHIPILICGFVCGWESGLVIGFVTPIIRSFLIGMPPMFPIAIAMSFELAVYGCLTGVFFRLFSKKNMLIPVVLIIAMAGGRIVWGIVSYVLFGLNGTAFSIEMFLAGGIVNAIPGILLQLVLIPIVIIALKKVKLLEYRDKYGR